MKIAFISAAKSIHIIRWANAMADRGHSVSVISCSNDIGDTNLYNSAVKIFKLKYSAPLGYYLNAGQLRQIVKKENFDVINVHYASGYGTLGRRAKLKNALLNVWGSDVYDFPYQSSFKMRLIKKNLSYYRYLASTSHCMASQAQTLVNREFEITPFGVDTSVFKPISGMKNENRILFGTVKTLSPKYGIADAIKAFIALYNRLQSEGKTELAEKIYYEIYGKGELKEKLQKLIDDNGMAERIKLCGYIENNRLPEVYNRFDVACFSSVLNSESFGVAAVEAMACGIPVCATAVDGFKEVVDDGVTGLLSPVGDWDKLAENMYKLLLDGQLREKMSVDAVNRVKELYNWSDNVETMLKIYRDII